MISGTPTTAGTYSTTVTVKDSTGATGTASFSWTVSTSGGGGGCTSTQPLANPGFESGDTGWTDSGVINNDPREPARSGSWTAWLNGWGSAHTDTLSQSVKIPAGCKATLTFYLHIDTAEIGSTAYDKLTVTAGSKTLATYSNANAASGYAQKSFDLSSLAGQTVTLKFTGVEDAYLRDRLRRRRHRPDGQLSTRWPAWSRTPFPGCGTLGRSERFERAGRHTRKTRGSPRRRYKICSLSNRSKGWAAVRHPRRHSSPRRPAAARPGHIHPGSGR